MIRQTKAIDVKTTFSGVCKFKAFSGKSCAADIANCDADAQAEADGVAKNLADEAGFRAAMSAKKVNPHVLVGCVRKLNELGPILDKITCSSIVADVSADLTAKVGDAMSAPCLAELKKAGFSI